jgi:hypothetical protein
MTNTSSKSGSKEKKTRRDFAIAALGAAAGVVSCLLVVPSDIDFFEERRRRRQEAMAKEKEAAAREGELHELLNRYLFPLHPETRIEARVPLVPALSDPWGPPKRQFSGSGREVAAAYTSAFRSLNDQYIEQSIIDVYDDDAPVLISSHLVSEPATRYFGDPKSPNPIHEVRYHDSGGGFRAGLRWVIYAPKDAKVVHKRELFQGHPTIRAEPIHNVSDLDNRNLAQPRFIRQGDVDYQEDDYLLISVLPRDSRLDRRMVSLAGLHKPGTLAAAQFLTDPILSLEVLRAIDKKVLGLPYYQAIIELKVSHNEAGLPHPTRLKLLDAEAIKVVTPLRRRKVDDRRSH